MWQNHSSLKDKCLLFRRTKAVDTVRREAYIPVQMPASPLWPTTKGNANLDTGHRTVLQVRHKRHICSIHCCMSCGDYFGQQKINPASYSWFQHSKLFSFPWLTRLGYSVQMKTKYFMDNNLQITVIPRINIVSQENWGEKQVTSTNQKTANTNCTS